jgi:WD40 repeat protein
VAFAPAGRYLAVGGKAGVWVWDLTSGELAFTAAADAGVQCWLAFSPDGRRLTRLARLARPPRPAGPTSPQIPFPAPDKQPAAPTDYACATWEVPGGRPVEAHRRPPLAGGGWANSAGGPFQAVIDRDRVRVLNVRSGAVAEFAHGHRAADQLEVSSGGRYLLTTGPNEPVKVWEVASGGLVHTNAPRPIRTGALTFRAEVLSPDGTRLMRLQPGSPGPVVEVWDVPGDRPVCAIPQAGPENLDGFRFNPNGRVLAGTTSAAIRVWDTETGRETFVLRGHGKVVIDVAVSDDGTRLASVGRDGTIRVWDISNFR